MVHDATYSDGGRPQQETLRVDPLLPQSKFDSKQASKTDKGTDRHGHKDDVQPSFNEPLCHSLANTTTKSSDAFFFCALEEASCMVNSRLGTFFEINVLEVGMANEVCREAAGLISSVLQEHEVCCA